MNELFQFHRELNIKKVLIIVAFILILIFLIFFAPKISKKVEEKRIENSEPNKIFSSSDNRISLVLPKEYGFSEYNPRQDYILELRAENNIDIFVSHKELIENRNFNNIVYADRDSYIKTFNTYSNLSKIADLTVNGNQAYSYSLHYLDNNVSYFLQIIWIQTDNGYYIIDIEFPLDTLDFNHKLINDVITNFEIWGRSLTLIGSF